MDAVIYYCKTCHYERPSRAIAQALEEQFGIRCEVKPAFWGTFRIELDGREVYNRWKVPGFLGRIGLARAPAPEEIVALVRQALGSVSTDPKSIGAPCTE